MPKIELAKPIRDALAQRLSRYLKDELGLEVAGFDAVFLADFVIESFGAHCYNQGLHDAQAIYRDRLEAISEAVYEIEQPTKL